MFFSLKIGVLEVGRMWLVLSVRMALGSGLKRRNHVLWFPVLPVKGLGKACRISSSIKSFSSMMDGSEGIIVNQKPSKTAFGIIPGV